MQETATESSNFYHQRIQNYVYFGLMCDVDLQNLCHTFFNSQVRSMANTSFWMSLFSWSS